MSFDSSVERNDHYLRRYIKYIQLYHFIFLLWYIKSKIPNIIINIPKIILPNNIKGMPIIKSITPKKIKKPLMPALRTYSRVLLLVVSCGKLLSEPILVRSYIPVPGILVFR